MALSSNALKKSVTAAPEEHDRRSSPDVHWAWSRIFADFEQRAAVFTDPRLPDNPVLYATKDFYDLTGYAPADVEVQ